MAFWNKKPDVPPNFDSADVARQERLERYRLAQEAYEATLPDPIVVEGPVDDNVKVNPARAMIDTSVDFLFGNEIKFELSPVKADQYSDQSSTDMGTPMNTTEDWLKSLNRCWRANRKQSLLQQMGKSGAIHGDVFIKFVPEDSGNNNEFPRMILLDPANVDIVTDPNDCNKVLEYSISYLIPADENGNPPTLRIQKITANREESPYSDHYTTKSWSMQNYELEMQWVFGAGWVPGDNVEVPVGPEVVWPYKWAPVEHCQNLELPNQVWGLADLDNSAVELIKSLQRATSSINKIVRIHGSPRMYAKGVSPDDSMDIDVSADNMITLPASGPDQDLKILNALSSVDSHIKFVQDLEEKLQIGMQVPAIALGKQSTASTAIGGLTLSILYAPILQKTRMKRVSYGDMIDRINVKLLILMGYDDESLYDGLTTIWPEAMPGSKYLDRQTIQQDQQMGLSKYTTMMALGYDAETEAQRRIQETNDELEMMAKIQAKYGIQSRSEPSATPGGNNNPTGTGNKSGSMGAVGNHSTKNFDKPTTPAARRGD